MTPETVPGYPRRSMRGTPDPKRMISDASLGYLEIDGVGKLAAILSWEKDQATGIDFIFQRNDGKQAVPGEMQFVMQIDSEEKIVWKPRNAAKVRLPISKEVDKELADDLVERALDHLKDMQEWGPAIGVKLAVATCTRELKSIACRGAFLKYKAKAIAKIQETTDLPFDRVEHLLTAAEVARDGHKGQVEARIRVLQEMRGALLRQPSNQAPVMPDCADEPMVSKPR